MVNVAKFLLCVGMVFLFGGIYLTHQALTIECTDPALEGVWLEVCLEHEAKDTYGKIEPQLILIIPGIFVMLCGYVTHRRNEAKRKRQEAGR